MSNPAPARIFTIDVDGKPVACFPADRWSEARELAREDWLRADLSTHISGGVPLAGPGCKIRSRLATLEEIARFERHKTALGRQPDDLELVYLVELDDAGSR